MTTVLSIQKREWIDSPTAKLTGNPLFCDGMQSLMVMTWCVRKCLHFQKEMVWHVFLNTWRCGSTERGVKGWESGCLGPYRFKVIISDTKEKHSIKNKYEMFWITVCFPQVNLASLDHLNLQLSACGFSLHKDPDKNFIFRASYSGCFVQQQVCHSFTKYLMCFHKLWYLQLGLPWWW